MKCDGVAHPQDDVEPLARRVRRIGDEPPLVYSGDERVFSSDTNGIVPLMDAIDAIGGGAAS